MKYKFISWNVNGIRAVDKKEALKWVDEDHISILGLQEIKATHVSGCAFRSMRFPAEGTQRSSNGHR